VYLKSSVEIKTESNIEIQNRGKKENRKYKKRRKELTCYYHWAKTIARLISPCARFTDSWDRVAGASPWKPGGQGNKSLPMGAHASRCYLFLVKVR
jgi:hypothetical protein